MHSASRPTRRRETARDAPAEPGFNKHLSQSHTTSQSFEANMKHFPIPLLILGIAALAACQQRQPRRLPQPPTAAAPAVIINGKTISTETFDFYVKSRANKATSGSRLTRSNSFSMN